MIEAVVRKCGDADEYLTCSVEGALEKESVVLVIMDMILGM